ncbi:Arm DNA-binding domain-containing protein [Lactococcus hircilactis]|nr:Arm DNA-binding domain-containing protein [Lactococcus hircilactis]
MPKISNVYQDKKSGKWYFVANLGYDEKGNRIRHWGRGYNSQREAKRAYDDYMNDFSDTAIKKK